MKRPMFQRRHYELIARSLAECPLEHLLKVLEMFELDNERFSRVRFLDYRKKERKK